MSEDGNNDDGSTKEQRKLSRRAALGVAVLATGGAAAAAWRAWDREESPPVGANATEAAGHPATAPSSPSTPQETIAMVGEDGFDITHGSVHVSAPAGVAPPGTRIAVSTPNEPVPPEISKISSVVGQPVSIVLGDELQPEQPISIAFDLRGTELAASISETVRPVVMSWSDTPDSLAVTVGEWDSERETLTVSTDHLTGFLSGAFDVGRYILDTIKGFLGITYAKPDCAFDPLTIGATPYSISHTGDDPIWPCLTADSNGGLSVVLHSNSNMAWAVASRPSVSGSVSGDWKDLGPGLAAIYQGIFKILGKDRAAVMPGGSVHLPFDPGSREIRVEIQQSPVLYVIATTLQAVVSVLDALPTGRVADAVLESFDAFDCLTELINTFYQEESDEIAHSVVMTTLGCVSAMIEEEKGSGFNFAVGTALAGVSMLSVAANTLIGAVQGIFREFTGNATGVYTIAADVQEAPASAPTGGDPRGPSLDEPIIVRWRFESHGAVYAPPAMVDGTIYLAKFGSLYAIDTATGEERWGDRGLYEQPGTPVVAEGLVFVTSIQRSGSMLQAFDLQSGAERWNSGGDSIYFSNPLVDRGVLYASANDTFYALDTATGKELWQAPYTIVSPKAVSDGVVYGINQATQGYRFLAAFDIASRSNRWMTSTRDDISTVTVTNDTVYVGSRAGDFHAVDATTGVERWSIEIGEGLWSNACVADGFVFVDGLTRFFALDVETGAERWRFTPGTNRIFPAQAVADHVMYVGSHDFLFALDTGTGEEYWRFEFETGNRIGGPDIAVAEGVVCAVYDSTNLVAFGNPATQSPGDESERVYTPE